MGSILQMCISQKVFGIFQKFKRQITSLILYFIIALKTQFRFFFPEGPFWRDGSHILTKLQLMSMPVFRCFSARHYRFEGKEKMVTHLIIKI